jgi:hypothetical protein
LSEASSPKWHEISITVCTTASVGKYVSKVRICVCDVSGTLDDVSGARDNVSGARENVSGTQDIRGP